MGEMEYIGHNSEQAAPSSSRAQHAGPGVGAGTGDGTGQGAVQSQTQSAQQTQPQSLYHNQNLNQSQQPQSSGCPYFRGAEHLGHPPHFHHPSHLPLPPQHPQFPQQQQQHPQQHLVGQLPAQHQSQGQHHVFLSQPQHRNNSSHHGVSHLHYDPVHAANSNSNWYPEIQWPGSAIPPYPIPHHHHSRTASSDTYFNTLSHSQGPGSASLGVPGLGLIHSQSPQHHLPQHEQFSPVFYRNLPPNVPRFPGMTNNPNMSSTTVNSAPPQPGFQQHQPSSLAVSRPVNLPAPNAPPPPHHFNMSGSGESSPDLSTNRNPMMMANMPDSMRGSNRNENGTRAAHLPPSRPTTTSLSNDPEPPRPEVGVATARSEDIGISDPGPGSSTGRRRAHPGRSAMYAIHASDYDTDDELDQFEEDQHAMRFVESISMGSGNFPRDMGEAQVRAHQILRGQIPNKRVASKKALSQLQSVDIDSLEESERTCVICYNEFGVENPEGINEAPLRLPGCKHIFGDHCIKKWFEESDSCPYCRDKVPSEPIIPRSAQYIRELYGQFPGRDPRRMPLNDLGGIRVVDRRGDESRLETSPPRAWQTGDRRSPPSEASDLRRRTRPRHSSSFRGSPSSAASHRHGSSHIPGSSSTAPVPPGPARERVNLPGWTQMYSPVEYSRQLLMPPFGTQFTNQRPHPPHPGSNAARFSMPPMPPMATYPSVDMNMPPVPFPNPLGLNGQPPMPGQMVAYPNMPNPNGLQPYSAPGLGGPGAHVFSSGGEPLPGPAQLDAYSQQLSPSASLPPVVASDDLTVRSAATNGPDPANG